MNYIMGVGNYSMFDDSIGIKIIEEIIDRNMDQGFSAIDLSGNLLNIFSYLNEDTKRIVIIDSGEFDLRPGEFIWFTPDLVVSTKELTNITSHEGDIIKVLKLALETGYHLPPIEIMGIQPESIKSEFGLSKTLQSNMERYIQEAIVKVLDE